MIKAEDSAPFLSRPLELPCGAVLKNRLVKSAMSDSLADGEGNPTEAQIRLYERWAEGGVALSIIGEVQGDPRFPEKPGNLVLGAHSNLEMLRQLATRASKNGTHIWPQLGHAGALSHSPISQPKGPSALEIGSFQCKGMSITEIKQLPDIYAKAALLAQEAGFTGVQIHAGHGFLLSQFLSPLFNRRNDQYGGSIEARCRIIIEVIDKVRRTVGTAFPIGIKINSTDQLEGGLTEEDALEAIRILNQTSIDLIELSGGTYFPGAKSSSDSSGGGPYFVDFSQRAQEVTSVPLVATGGFKTRAQALSSLASGTVDMLGVARAMVLNTSLANDWLAHASADPVFPRFEAAPPGGITAWYTMRLTALGNDDENNFVLDLPSAIRVYEERDNSRCITWEKAFSHYSP
ncbi:NADH:flavin oxidoreductase/NADH oxidase family protein [Neptunomonas antarctica]|uniref:2,4-dienoyl-CoA reductase n=1 Tax=Neptunomonas antarctica TaxID=619304 RepID=A0A1N7NEF4_9GAMM|nr:NADH:flavin oxidoreductase/NADH oxidase family protein [Neptunomonas antarctica]SIS96682.1 2,4-dienoyl-CoA reductase [Neptunomonas antarctica]